MKTVKDELKSICKSRGIEPTNENMLFILSGCELVNTFPKRNIRNDHYMSKEIIVKFGSKLVRFRDLIVFHDSRDDFSLNQIESDVKDSIDNACFVHQMGRNAREVYYEPVKEA